MTRRQPPKPPSRRISRKERNLLKANIRRLTRKIRQHAVRKVSA